MLGSLAKFLSLATRSSVRTPGLPLPWVCPSLPLSRPQRSRMDNEGGRYPPAQLEFAFSAPKAPLRPGPATHALPGSSLVGGATFPPSHWRANHALNIDCVPGTAPPRREKQPRLRTGRPQGRGRAWRAPIGRLGLDERARRARGRDTCRYRTNR